MFEAASAPQRHGQQLDLFSGLAFADEPRFETVDEMPRDRELELASEGRRKSVGAYYTPADVVEGLLTLVLDPVIQARSVGGADALMHIRVLDPACGTGNFLLAAGHRIADALVDAGVAPAEAHTLAFGRCAVGVDIDPEAAEICANRVRSAMVASDDALSSTAPQVWCADSLLMPLRSSATLFTSVTRTTWEDIEKAVCVDSDGFDVVIGNPPFLNQLSASTSRSGDYARELDVRFGDVVGGYADPAVIFLLLSTQLARSDGGRISMIEPVSMLAARDAARIREAVLRHSRFEGIWLAMEKVFDAAVDVCAPILVRDDDEPLATLWVGRSFGEATKAKGPKPADNTWSSLLAAATGVPDVEIQGSGRTFGDEVRATADFRDQYYGLAPHVVDMRDGDDSEFPRLVTAGLIDPARNYWGEKPTKFNKRSYECPRVAVRAMEPALSEWARRRLVPKLLVATQTKVLEVWVDVEGQVLPSVPVVTVEASHERLWHIAVALSSPVVTMVAAQRHIGGGLSATALKLSAKDIAALPLPLPSPEWDEAAQLFRAASTDQAAERPQLLERSGALMCLAYGVQDAAALVQWWRNRLVGSMR